MRIRGTNVFSVVNCAFWRMSVSPHMSLTDVAQVADWEELNVPGYS